MNSERMIQQAVRAAQTGSTARAQAILKQLLLEDNQNETAWLVLESILEGSREKINCLKQVLRINPENPIAQLRLMALNKAEIHHAIPAPTSPASLPVHRKTPFWEISLRVLGVMMFVLIIASLGISGGILFYNLYTDYFQDNQALAFTNLNNTSGGAYSTPAEPTLIPTATSSQTVTPTSSPTATFTPTLTPQPTSTATASITPTPTATATPSFTPTYTYPAEALITDIKGSPQTLPLSCESNSAVDWALFFDVEIGEMEFFNKLPISENPEEGFVGDVNGTWGQIPPGPYGVHAGPVAFLLREYSLNASALRDLTWDDLRREIAENRPVIVWVVGKIWTNVLPVIYTDSNGNSTTVVRYEHTVMVIGYDAENVFILDGADRYQKPIEKFMASWDVLGNMAIIWVP